MSEDYSEYDKYFIRDDDENAEEIKEKNEKGNMMNPDLQKK